MPLLYISWHLDSLYQNLVPSTSQLRKLLPSPVPSPLKTLFDFQTLLTSSMSNPNEDLDLLLSIGVDEERVLETPPGSPSHYSPDDGLSRSFRSSNMSAFRDTVKGYLDVEEPNSVNADEPILKPKKSRKSSDVDIEKYSGLRIKNQLVSAVEMNNRFSEVRFVRMSVIRNLIMGDTLSGCWATVGILMEKGASKMSSSGKKYCIWKMGCLDETNVSVFLFGDAYTNNIKCSVGDVFALFNASVRKDAHAGTGFSISIFSAGNILKLGKSVDYGICKGKRKDGVSCTMVINRHQGQYCKYHSSRTSQTQRYSTNRTELKGGNIKMSYRFQPRGVYMVDPMEDRLNLNNKPQPTKVLSVDGLKRVLSKAETTTSNVQSQGLRFLSQVTASKVETKSASKTSINPIEIENSLGIRPSSTMTGKRKVPEAKEKKAEHASTEKMIELDMVSSDDDCVYTPQTR